MKDSGEPKNWIDYIFDAFIIVKGVDGVLETIGGLLLTFTNRAKLNEIAIWLTQRELSQDPDDRLSHWLLEQAAHLSVSAKMTGVIYLLVHGIIKITLVVTLLRNKIWAFPVAVVFLTSFAFYQLYRFTLHFSWPLLVLSMFDFVIVILIQYEYNKHRHTHTGPADPMAPPPENSLSSESEK